MGDGVQRLRGSLLLCGLAVGMLGIILVGCGGAAKAPEAADASSARNKSAADQSTTEPTEVALPGEDEFGLNLEELVPMGEKVETLIASCMSDAGFEYIAVDWDTIRAGMNADKHLPGLPEDEYVKVHGFGISTTYTGGPPQLNEMPIPAQVGLGEKNVEIFKNLSPADQVAYNHTLLGEKKDASFAMSLEFEDFSLTGGCTRDAVEEVFGADRLRPGLANPLDFVINQDPRMVGAREAYAECLAKEGYEYTHPEQVDSFLRDGLDEITGGAPVDKLSAENQEALKKLQEIERKLAPISHFCELEHYDTVADQILSELYTGTQR